ncbi:Protein MSP1 [Smittium culicis]|uniref:Protein MSP1 n=1 Tax=Smittium culicis TaxID=133412 RepID=A0A1R1WXT4_9FUNG|nr:Protein MSP1 [Smittium culicis]
MSSPMKKIAIDVAILVLTQVVVYYGFKYVLGKLDPESADKNDVKNNSKHILNRLNLKNIKLNQYEKIIMNEVIIPENINVSFKDIGGLDDVVNDLKESIIYPILHPKLFHSENGLLGSPKGILLYGPPGCGKTMLAKALAKESGARFINLQFSTLMDKWFGESNKLVRATFTLAEKLQPAIIFIDEIDSFMRTRQSSDHEALSTMKAEFMSLWDGLKTTNQLNSIIVIGATNRPNDIDLAIMRRMPKRFLLKPPGHSQRVEIFKLILSSFRLEPDFDFDLLARKSATLSGSDIKELCRNAAMNPVYEYMRNNPLPQIIDTNPNSSSSLNSPQDIYIKHEYDQNFELRPLRIEDFEVALHKIDETLLSSYNGSVIDSFLEIEEND